MEFPGRVTSRSIAGAEGFHANLWLRWDRDFELLSIDIDFNDYWVWRAIDDRRFSAQVRQRRLTSLGCRRAPGWLIPISMSLQVVVVEYNGHFPPEEARTVKYKVRFSLFF
jgi:hypothetical protein